MTVNLSPQQAEKLIDLLEGWSLVLRSSFPQRLLELLQQEMDQTGVYEALRYEPPMGPSYVADEADALVRILRDQMAGGDSR